MYFGFGQYVLAEPRWKALEMHARWLLGHPDLVLRLVGVCDSQEYVQEASALLVYRRQLAVKNGLVHLGVPEDRLVVKFEEPSEVAGRMLAGPDGAINRRVDFVGSGPFPPPAETRARADMCQITHL